MSWGIPERQSFKVFIDTTNQLSWVYNESVNTRQSTFDTSKPSSFDSLNTTTSFAYQSQITQIQKGKNWLIVEDRNNVWDLSVWTPFSLANQNGLLTEREGVSGFLCFNRQNNVMQRVGDISIDMPNNNIYFGEYIPSYIHNQSVAIELSNTINDKLKKIWTFDIDVYINTHPALEQNIFRGVIDSASPYITIYAKSEDYFQKLWRLLDASNPNESFNCNYTTGLCSNINKVMSSMTIAIKNPKTHAFEWNISFFQEDIIVDKRYVQFVYDNSAVYTTDTDYVLFLGRPFLNKLFVTMGSAVHNGRRDVESVTFYTLKIKVSLYWITNVIAFVPVVAFSLIF
eukprot:414922_1